MRKLQPLLLAVAALLASTGPARAETRELRRALEPAAVARQVAQAAPNGVTPPPADPMLTPAPRGQTSRAGEVTVADETPAYKKWWFWALTAAVVGGTVALGTWAVDAGSDPAKGCAAGTVLCFGDGRTR